MTRDELLDHALAAVRASDAEARGEPEDAPGWPADLPLTGYRSPAELAEARALQARSDKRPRRERAEEEAEALERDLVRYSAARWGPTGQAYERPVSLHAQADAHFRQLCRTRKNSMLV